MWDSLTYSNGLEAQKAATANHLANTALYCVKARDTARFAFKVVDDAGEGFKIAAATLGAVIERLLVCFALSARSGHGTGHEGGPYELPSLDAG